MNKNPTHIALIADGNNRWAKKQSVSALEGYKAGGNAIKNISFRAKELKIPYITFYLFSLENLKKRSQVWLDMFFDFANTSIENFIKENIFDGVSVRIIGDWKILPTSLKNSLQRLCDLTASNVGLTLTLAIAYTGKDEIVRAINSYIQKNSSQSSTSPIPPITLEAFEDCLDTRGIPDPDLMIRTGGDVRLSGFLLWQLAYTEMLFVPEFWPDFTPQKFDSALETFQNRTRNYGKERARES